MGTKFAAVYDRFLGKITDDLYVELTPEDTIKDLRNLLIEAIPGFEFPRKNLYNYTILDTIVDLENFDEESSDGWYMGTTPIDTEPAEDLPKQGIVDNSYFEEDLTSEEINILSYIMLEGWIQRQLTSIENTRMKYSGSDFKFTSQANHIQKLSNTINETRTRCHHLQRLYKRRRFKDNDEVNGKYESNWSIFGYGVYNPAP